MGGVLMSCPNCGEQAPEEAKFCEACGHELQAVVLPACVACGEREVAEEGYCLSCGHKQPAERDHMFFNDGPAAAVTDRGKRHRHNEDAVAIATTDHGVGVLVVCDGVSSTSGSAEASLRAANTARDLLVLGLSGDPSGGDGTDASDPHGATADTDADTDAVVGLLARATEAAQVEASASAEPGDGIDGNDNRSAPDPDPAHDGGSPSSTFVAVVAEPRDGSVVLTTAWVGDSRAYWVGHSSQRLTGEDHELGGSLVRWLGADSINATPEIRTVTVEGPGHVVVCSDGLWRYAADVGELSELMERLVDNGRLGVDLAADMVAFANNSGGHDNITVALWTNDVDLAGPGSKTDPEAGGQDAGPVESNRTETDQVETPPDDDTIGEGE